jgi:PAS domain S-box-containing protein
VPTTQAQWLYQVGSVLETLNQGVVISDEDRRIVFANCVFLEMSKMSAEEVLRRSVMDLYPPDEVARLQEFIARREAHGRARYEFYIPQADGGRLPVAVTSCLVHGGDGRAYGIVTATDISDQKRAQMELSQTNALLLERHRQMEQQLQLAERVQQSLAPKGLTWGGVPVAVLYQPASSIGGDYGLVIPSDDRLDVASATLRVTASVRPSSPIASTTKQWRRLSAVWNLRRCCGFRIISRFRISPVQTFSSP